MEIKELDVQIRIRIKSMIELLGDTNNKVILDLGANKKTISYGMNAKKIITLDAVKNSKVGIKCDLENERIPLENGSVDTIIVGELIEHIRNTRFFLESCRRILKEDGKLILSTPNICCLKDRIRMIFGRVPNNCAKCSMEGNDKYNTHVRDFNLKQLKEVLNISGFEIEKLKTNGIISHSRLLFPIRLTPIRFGEGFIIRCKLSEDSEFIKSTHPNLRGCGKPAATSRGYVKCGDLAGGDFVYCEECDADFVHNANKEEEHEQ